MNETVLLFPAAIAFVVIMMVVVVKTLAELD